MDPIEGFAWAANNLGVGSPQELQAKGVNVFFAPNISRGGKVVDLADGRVDVFQPEERPPRAGYYADYASLERYCRAHHIPLSETEGRVSVEPFGGGKAGDPLRYGGD